MDVHSTPPPVTLSAGTCSPSSDLVMKIGRKGMYTDGGDFAALVGGIVGSLLVILICFIAVLLWCFSRHKGSYVTNETDDDEMDDDDDESVGSDRVLQSKEPLKSKEDK